MAAGFGERQRADQFARLLDSLDAGPHTGVATLDGPRDGYPAEAPARPASRIPAQPVDPELAAMLRAVEAIIDEGRVHAPMIRPAFKEELGRRLQEDFLRLFNADVDSGDGGDGDLVPRHRAGSPWRRRLLGGSVAVGVLSGGIGGVAWAASSALPGDPLYGVKRSLENMRVSVSGSDLERGEQYLGQAKTRLGEINRLLAHHEANVDGSDVSSRIDATMDSFYEDVDNAGQLLVPLAEKGDADALAHLQDFLTVYGPQVHDLETLLAPSTQGKAQHLQALMQSFQIRLTAAKAAIERAKSTPGHASTPGSHRSDAAPTAAASGNTTVTASEAHGGTVQNPGPAGSGATTLAASGSTPLNLQVPLGSPATTVVVPPLLSGLPPIGITLGGPAPSQSGPSGPTSDAGPPATDPNPN
jgi:hypothetical protein